MVAAALRSSQSTPPFNQSNSSFAGGEQAMEFVGWTEADPVVDMLNGVTAGLQQLRFHLLLA